MSNVDEILSYKKNPDEDFYALLNCDESSSVGITIFHFIPFIFDKKNSEAQS